MTKLVPIILFSIIMAWLSENASRHRLNENGKLVYTYKDKFFYFILAASMAVFVGLRTRGNDTYAYRLMYENIGAGLENIAGIDWRNIASARIAMLLCDPENTRCNNAGLFHDNGAHYGRYLSVVYQKIHLQYFSQCFLFYHNGCIHLYHGGHKADDGCGVLTAGNR